VISDTFGVVEAAAGSPTWPSVARGIRAVVDLRGTVDALGRELVATEICVVDEVAAAADLVMGKARGVPVAVVRGVEAAVLGGEVPSPKRWSGPTAKICSGDGQMSCRCRIAASSSLGPGSR